MATRETEVKRSRGLKQQPKQEKPSGGNLLTSPYVLGGIGVVVLVGALILAIFTFGSSLPGQTVEDLGNQHVQPGEPHIPYNSNPPTSGPHYGNLANWGEHTEPIVDELQIHNLEDGGVIVHYSCPEECPELVEQLRGAIGEAFGNGSFEEAVQRTALRPGDPNAAHWILVPRPDMDTQIALTAWTRIDKLDEFDQERIVSFLKQFEGIDHHR